MAVHRASDFGNMKDAFTEHGPAWAFGLGKQSWGKYIVYELKASSLYMFLIVMFCIIRNTLP